MRTIIWAGLGCLVVVVDWKPFTDGRRGEEPKSQKWPRIDQSQYAGSKRCAECHQTYYEAWKDTAHNKSSAHRAGVGEDFSLSREFSRRSNGTGS